MNEIIYIGKIVMGGDDMFEEKVSYIFTDDYGNTEPPFFKKERFSTVQLKQKQDNARKTLEEVTPKFEVMARVKERAMKDNTASVVEEIIK